jgi:hypothetical protein
MKPIGNEDPHDLVKKMSDDIINQIIERKPQLENHPMVGCICQLCDIERHYRDGHLNEDWIWKWDSSTSGHISYKTKEHMTSIIGIYHTNDTIITDGSKEKS